MFLLLPWCGSILRVHSLIPSFQAGAKSLPTVLHCATASLNLAMSGASLCSGMVGIKP
jgi:hypothetical protein